MSIAEPMRVDLTLELASAEGPPSGRVVVAGTSHPFSGWLGLAVGAGEDSGAPCADKQGDALRKCRAFASYKAFTAKCDALTAAAHQRSCVKRAKRSYKHALELIRCRKLKGNARRRCERKARAPRAVASATALRRERAWAGLW